MKLSEEHERMLKAECRYAAQAIQDEDLPRAAEYLLDAMKTAVQIGYEMAMSHTHSTNEPVYSGAQLIRYDANESGPAKRI